MHLLNYANFSNLRRFTGPDDQKLSKIGKNQKNRDVNIFTYFKIIP